MQTGLADILESVKRTDIWLFFAWSDTRARYKRSVLGPFWLTLGTAIGAAGLGYLWATLLNVDKATLIPSLTGGLIVWQLLAGTIIEGTQTFSRQASIIRNLPLPYFLHPLQLISRQFVNFAHNLIVFVLVAVIFQIKPTLATLLFIPGLLLVFINLSWIALLVGMLSARFRDIGPMLEAFIPLLFFLTPVLYRPDQVGFNSMFLLANPLSHLLLVVREPMLGHAVPVYVWAINLAMAIAGWTVALAVFNRRRHRIPFWV